MSVSTALQQRAEENAKKIAEQIEFYLGDVNLATDKYFRELAQNGEGWVSLDSMLRCSRLKKYTKDPVELVYSLEKYSTVFVLDAEGKRIKRKEPFLGESDWVRQDRNDRTVCVRQFRDFAEVEALHEYFTKFGPMDGMKLNKFENGFHRGKFNGIVSCIFKNKADAEKFMAASVEETKFNGIARIREWHKGHR